MIFLGISLICLPVVIGCFIVPLYHMIDCLINGGDWEYYGEQVVIFLFIISGTAGFIILGIGLSRG